MGKETVGNTIIGVSMRPQPKLKSLLSTDDSTYESTAESFNQNYLKIRAANSDGQRSSASILINKMYASYGYLSSGLPSDKNHTNSMTLTANEGDITTGTLTIGFDGPAGLLVDDLFKAEIDSLRNAGRKVCEFTKFAMDSTARSERALASLFHVAYIYAHRIHGFQDLTIEVNPRHVPYYKRVLGFTVFGPERLNRRVNAPAVLLRLDFSYVAQKIGEFGGSGKACPAERSLYPYLFSVQEEAGIVGRLRGLVAVLDDGSTTAASAEAT